MGVLKSLGLSPAKRAGSATSKAFRRLFGRVLPAGDDDETSDSVGNLSQVSENDLLSKQNKLAGNQDSLDQPNSQKHGSPQDPEGNSLPSTNNSCCPASTTGVKETFETPEIRTNTAADNNNMILPMQKPSNHDQDKENHPPSTTALVDSLTRLDLNGDGVASDITPTLTQPPSSQDQSLAVERAIHMKFTDEALDMARLALKTNETPVGCVIVHNGKVIARGMNATNVTRNGTRHAEFMALAALLSHPPKDGPKTTCLKPKGENVLPHEASDASSIDSHPLDEGNEDGSKGHLYPYGQKLHPASQVDRTIIRESTLYVTVEPCVMCASLLRQLGIKKVYFGAVNDKFGGTGGVFSIHANSLPVSCDGQTASAHPTPAPTHLPDGSGTLGVSFPPSGGDGGNIETGYQIEGGWGRDEAVALLRRFYVQENGRAPVPRKKEGRAARLAAMMEKDDDEQLDTVDNSAGQDEEQPNGHSAGELLGEKVNIESKDRLAVKVCKEGK